jgi:hypothetical protein
MSRITTTIKMIAMRLKQMDEILQPIPGREATATLTPKDAIAMASVGTHRGTRDRSRRDANQSSAAPTMSVAANGSRMIRN